MRLLLYGSPALVLAHAGLIEPRWLKVRHHKLPSTGQPCRFVHFTDLHYKGNRSFLRRVVQAINRTSPDFVVFTGDVIEEASFLKGAVEELGGLKAPLFAVPGNHDYWASIDFAPLVQCCESTGGRWLEDESITLEKVGWTITGETCLRAPADHLAPNPRTRNLLLVHYPAWADKLGGRTYDLILAGHSHGGQVRLPFIGPLVTPFGVGDYDLGHFSTPGGPLYVGSGVGWFYLPFRFNCRPEIVVFDA